MVNLEVEYAAWLQALPDNQQETAIAEALRAVVDVDLFASSLFGVGSGVVPLAGTVGATYLAAVSWFG